MLQPLQCTFLITALLLCLPPLSGAEETNADVRRAELEYAQELAEIKAEAQKDIEKAQEELVEVLEKELSRATKKGNFDEAMRLKGKLEAFRKQKPEQEVSDLFGESGVVAGETKQEAGAAQTVNAASSEVPIVLSHISTAQGKISDEELKKISGIIIDNKTNTATFTMNQMRTLCNRPTGFISVFLEMGKSKVIVVNHNSDEFMLRGEKNEPGNFSLRRGCGGPDGRVIVNYDIASKAYKQLQADDAEPVKLRKKKNK